MQMLDSYATNFDSSTHCAKRDLDIATDIATHTDLEDSFRGEDAIEYVGDFFNDDEIARFDANIDEFMKNTAESLPTSAGTDGVASHMAHLPADKQTHHSRDTVEKEIDHSRSSIPVNGLSSKVDLEKDATQPANSANSPSLPSRIIKTRPLQLKKSRSSGVSVDPSMRESLFKDIEPGEICLPAKLAKSNDVELEKRIELVQSPAVKLRVLSPLSTPDAKSRSSDIHKKNPDSSFARADAFKSRKSKSYGTPRPESRRDSRYSPLPIRSAPRRKEKYDPKNSAYIPKPSSDHFSKHSYRSSASTPCTCKCAKHCSTSLDVSYEKKRENYADDEYIRKPKYISSTLKDKSSRKNDRDYYDRYDKKITSSRSDDRHFKDDIREKPKSTRKSYPVVKYSNEDATYDRRDYNSKS